MRADLRGTLLELRPSPRKCLHLYHAAGLEYVRQDNCFPWIADWARAQALMGQQVKANWPQLLDGIAGQLNPIHSEIFRQFPIRYYWSTYQSEGAIDIVFHQAADLRRLYPRLVHPGMTTFSSPDVMRYLGKQVLLSGDVPKRFSGEMVSDLKRREEGVRIKHLVNGNSLKLYDKAFTVLGSVLRGEATMNNGHDFRVYRPKEGDPGGKMAWRRGIAATKARSLRRNAQRPAPTASRRTRSSRARRAGESSPRRKPWESDKR